MLDIEQIMRMFSLFSDLEGEALEHWGGLCRAAGARLEARLRADADVEAGMEALCTAAAACAYGDFLMLERAAGASDEVRVGDISLKSSASAGGERRDAEEIRDYFLASVAHLLTPEAPVLLATGGAL